MAVQAQYEDFLFELGTEELPPKALLHLSTHLCQSIATQLDELGFSYTQITPFASPRRLAILIDKLQLQQADYQEQKLGPPVSAAFDDNGIANKIAQGFARSHNISVDQLEQIDSEKGLRIAATIEHQGRQAADTLPTLISQALQTLPIPKRMRWGASRTEFIRPVHWLVMLLGNEVISCQILALSADRTTFGHRFHHPEAITLEHPRDYRDALLSHKVIASFEQRQTIISSQITAAANSVAGIAKIDQDLLDEVTALVEWPVAIVGKFDDVFLQVPHEALISSMQEHQKYFPVFTADHHLQANFITVANIESANNDHIARGNERVIRPRLADAAFFFNTDKKTSLAARVENLTAVVFQQKLGSLFDKTQRITQLVKFLTNATASTATSDALRAAQLCKADLITDMVYEFSDLQGIAGYYYAQEDGENNAVALAIKEHYLPKFSGDALPESDAGTLVAIADRIDTIVGIFGIGQIPTGSKDPFALRRASVSVLRLLIEKNIDLDLAALIDQAIALYGDVLSNHNTKQDCLSYILERLRAFYEEKNIDINIYLAVAEKQLTSPLDFNQRIYAVQEFSQLAAASTLAAANKRVSNLLAKAKHKSAEINHALLQEAAEKNLVLALEQAQNEVMPLLQSRNYTKSLQRLAKLKTVIDQFFEDVMVMTEEDALRNNRLAILQQLHTIFFDVADISYLANK